jgi:hypothetical protein
MCVCALYACCYLCAVCVCSVTGLDNDMTSDDTKRELKPEKKKIDFSKYVVCNDRLSNSRERED